VTIGRGGEFERLTAELLRELFERGGGRVCICLMPGTHDVEALEVDGTGEFRLSLHGCGHASQVNLRGPWTFNAFAAIEVRDLTMRAEGDTRLLFQKNNEIRVANVLFDRSGNASRAAAVAVVSAQSVSMTGCEILTRRPSMAVMFQGVDGLCRVVQNRFEGIVSFYGETEEPVTPDLLRVLAARDNLRLTPNASQLSFCDNELTQLSIATALARRLATPTGTANGLFASAVIHGNTLIEQNNLFVAALLGVDANAFIAPDAGDSIYGVMLAMRATVVGNLALVNDDVAPLRFVVPNPTSFSKAANQVFVTP
jgi:hypothetical protein